MRTISLGVLAILGGAGLGAHDAQAETLNRWVQYGPDKTALVRALTDDGACPNASVGGASLAMQVRAAPTAAFPVTECQLALPIGTEHGAVTIEGVTLKLPTLNPKRIVVIGDTGCRLKGSAVQACDDPAAFPLKHLAAYVASFEPDMIIHVGDYYYRESACPAGNTGCAGSPHGDTWASWNADWFQPAKYIMAAAPVALTRGNHESCGRGQQGWFTLMDPRPYDANAVACTPGSTYDTTAPYVVRAGATDLLMFDSSYANDSAPDTGTVQVYQAQLAAALQGLVRPTLFVTHKPSYGLIAATGTGHGSSVSGGDATEQVMFADGVPEPIKLLLSGHIHNFQAVQLVDKSYAPQLVVGNSGTLLDPDYVPDNQGGGTYTTAAGTSSRIVRTSDQSEFGFAVMDATSNGFKVSVYNLTGTPHGNCVITYQPRNISCSE